MCFPEDDLPKNVLLSEFTEDEIENISKKASELFSDDLEELIEDIEFEQSNLNESIQQLVLSINNLRKEFARSILVKEIDSLYKLISDRTELAKNLKSSIELYKFYQQISELSDQIDLCLLKVLFELTEIYESLDIIPLAPHIVLNLYGKSCEIAMKLVDSNQKEKLEKCRNFFFDSAKWIRTRGNEWPSKMKKKYPNLGYEISCLKKLIKRKKMKSCNS